MTAVGATMFAVRKIAAWRRPATGDRAGGRIAPGKILAGLCLAVAALMAAGGVAALVSGQYPLGSILVALALVLGIPLLPSLSHWHDISWDDEGLSGPDHLSQIILGRSRASIDWRDVATRGKTLGGYDYIESRFGTRIYWSYLYPGHGTFEAALALYCPQLARS